MCTECIHLNQTWLKLVHFNLTKKATTPPYPHPQEKKQKTTCSITLMNHKVDDSSLQTNFFCNELQQVTSKHLSSLLCRTCNNVFTFFSSFNSIQLNSTQFYSILFTIYLYSAKSQQYLPQGALYCKVNLYNKS